MHISFFSSSFLKLFKKYNANADELKQYPTGYDGSFDHPISIKILNEVADIVCTNPPFSRAKEYWKLIIDSGKKFLIISNLSNFVTTTFIKYFKDNKVWAGYNEVHKFLDPKRQIVEAPGIWYTNFPIKDRPRNIQLKMMPLKDIPDKYKKIDDTGILIVNNCYIPNDYDKPIAISINPMLCGILEKGYKIVLGKTYHPHVNGKMKFSRVLVQKV